MESFLEMVVGKCPRCGNFIIEPAWFAIDLEQDIECAVCRKTFNMKKHMTDKVMFVFSISPSGKIDRVNIKKEQI